MKFSATFVSLALFVSLAVAAPAPAKSVTPVSKESAKGQAASGAVGAAYFITNEADGNFVVSADIKSDGTVTLSRATSTGGRGLTGTTDPASKGPDGLFSQGSIKASKTGEFLVAVNPGSNTVTPFIIDPNNPSTLTPMGGAVSSEGEFPMSLAITKDGKRVCVLNGGAVAGVNCYTADKKNGLTAIPGSLRALDLKQTTPPKGPENTASHILFSEDENSLMASIKGTPAQPGFLAVWDVSKDGKLSEKFNKILPAKGGALPFGMSIIPGGNAALVTDPAGGFDIFDLGGTSAADEIKAGNENNKNGKDNKGGNKNGKANTSKVAAKGSKTESRSAAEATSSSAVQVIGNTGDVKIVGREIVTVTVEASATKSEAKEATKTQAGKEATKTQAGKEATKTESKETKSESKASKTSSSKEASKTDSGKGNNKGNNKINAEGLTLQASGKSALVKVDGQKAVCWSSHSQKTGNFYLTDIGTSKVTEVNVDKNLKATVVKQYDTTADSAAIDTDIATVNGNDFLYVLGANKSIITVFALPAAGQAAQKQVLQLGASAQKANLKLSAAMQGMTTFLK